MVLHGDVTLQKDESAPVEGFTVTATSALTPLRHAAQSNMVLKSDAATFGRGFLYDTSLPGFIRVKCRRTETNDTATATNTQKPASSATR